MDGVQFDAIARELRRAMARRGLLRGAAGVVGAVGAGVVPGSDFVRARRKRRKCGKGRKRCGRKCVRGSCCPGKPCGGELCSCIRSLAGKTFCSANLAVQCVQCPAAGCGSDARCVAGECGMDVTAVCRPECGAEF